jgi:endonuclease/exonuclease/phosphatase family metal-dependent hydrolase
MPENKRNIGLSGYVLRFVNIIATAGLLLAYFSRFIPPDKLWIPAFFGLSYPAWFIINAYFTIHWIWRRRWFFLIPAITLVLGFSLPLKYFGFGSNVETAEKDGSIKVMTYNVHDFDYYSRTYSKDNVAADMILDFINKENPDIICFQEFYSNPLRIKKNNFLRFKIKTDYKYVARYKYNNRSSYLFLVIYSKFPVIHDGFINNAPGNKDITGIYADIKGPEGLLRVYNVHLNSTQISSQAYVLEEDYDVTRKEDVEKAAKGAKRIMARMRRGYEKRSLQIKLLRKHIESSPYPVVLTGDFNDTPCSYSYWQMTRDLTDCFTEKGKGFSTTYNGPYPSFRIDYIMHDENFICTGYERKKLEASDHFPVTATLQINENGNGQ